MSSSFSMFSQSREDFLKRKQALITTIRKEKEAHKLIQQPLTHKKTMPNKPRHTKMKVGTYLITYDTLIYSSLRLMYM